MRYRMGRWSRLGRRMRSCEFSDAYLDGAIVSLVTGHVQYILVVNGFIFNIIHFFFMMRMLFSNEWMDDWPDEDLAFSGILFTFSVLVE